VAARAISYGLIIKALLKLKLPVTTQAAILISGHSYPPLLCSRYFLLLRAFFCGGLSFHGLFLYSAFSGFKFAIQVHAAYLEGWLMGLQYMLMPTVGVYKDTTGTMENDPVKNQWISAHSAIHLLTSRD
jgi:hypothetical protein